MNGWLGSPTPGGWRIICMQQPLAPASCLELLKESTLWKLALRCVPSWFPVPACGIGDILTALQASSGKCGGAERARWERPGVRMKRAQNGLCQPLLKAGWDHDCRYPPVPSAEPGQHSETKGWHLPRRPVRACRAAPGPGSLPIPWWSIIFPWGRREGEMNTAMRGSLRLIKFDLLP